MLYNIPEVLRPQHLISYGRKSFKKTSYSDEIADWLGDVFVII